MADTTAGAGGGGAADGTPRARRHDSVLLYRRAPAERGFRGTSADIIRPSAAVGANESKQIGLESCVPT